MVGICYVGPFLDSSGYGEATRNFLVALREVNANVMAQKVSYTGPQHYKTTGSMISEELSLKKIPYKIKILHVTPDNYKNLAEVDKYNIGHLFWETDRLPKSWVAPCNKLQEIWTGTKYGAAIMKESGVTVPITVIPEAIETNPPSGELRPYVLPNFRGLVFYSIFEWIERKNPKRLLFSFWKAFRGKTDVCLLLKVHKSGQTDRGLRDILIEARGWKNSLVWKDTPRVFIHSDIMDQEQMARFHKTGNIYVSAHRGEGWGIPQCEASMYLHPVISVGYGGIHEYWHRNDYYPVDFTMVPIEQTYNRYYEEGMQWADASDESLVIQMQKLYERINDPKRKGLAAKTAYGARGVVQSVCAYNSVGKKMVDRIEEISKEKGWSE
jgi:hypothetical protein